MPNQEVTRRTGTFLYEHFSRIARDGSKVRPGMWHRTYGQDSEAEDDAYDGVTVWHNNRLRRWVQVDRTTSHTEMGYFTYGSTSIRVRPSGKIRSDSYSASYPIGGRYSSGDYERLSAIDGASIILQTLNDVEEGVLTERRTFLEPRQNPIVSFFTNFKYRARKPNNLMERVAHIRPSKKR